MAETSHAWYAAKYAGIPRGKSRNRLEIRLETQEIRRFAGAVTWHPPCTGTANSRGLLGAMGAGGKGCMAVEYIWVQSENGATMMARQPAPDPKGLFGEEGFTFKDALDIINPL
ncbi:MAG: hypothetical protein JO021_22865, partial [Alphaproteobacteria bacterium]|nr:hypothetical protein [Alphaproteobacteria bacterium]